MANSSFSRRVSEFVGIAFFAGALLWLIALLTYQAGDAVWFFNTGGQVPPANFAGRIGAFLAELSYQTFGYAAYLGPGVVSVLGWHYFWCCQVDAPYTKTVGVVLLFGCLASFLSLAFGSLDVAGKEFLAGGYLGQWAASWLAEYLNRIGSIVLIFTMLFMAIVLATQFSFGRLSASAYERAGSGCARALGAYRSWRESRRRERQRREVLRKHLGKREPAPVRGSAAASKPVTGKVAVGKGSESSAERTVSEPKVPARRVTPPQIARDHHPTTTPVLPLPEPMPRSPAERRKGAFQHPPLALLDAARRERKIDERELMEGAKLLEEKCREFSVEGTVVQIHPGPVVTTYEFKPDAGIKYSKITSLAEDLSLAMQAESVLIERLPGRSTVGIQIPNHSREIISLRELLESEAYRRSQSKLTLVLGKGIHGEPFVTDLATMPHLLIAGATGTGKSVALNAMLTSVLYRCTPDEVRFILIDPKRLELGMYEDIPHLLTPVVVDPKRAANALRWAVREMEERYKLLAAEGVRNIEQYNRNVRLMLEERGSKKAAEGDSELPETLPFVVVVIDELADLMMVASGEVEESIARLAQMARAVGIHLILATQRPSVDVITGLIKANLPARISFRVSSKVDSRTILDANGAEQLLGNGDLLYMPPASSRCVRVHGPYISEQESARLASFLRKQGKPAYDESITVDEKVSEAISMEKDDLYDDATRIVVSAGQASISYLQRRLRIGFSRAARLIDMMEAEGLVSGNVGGKPREVLVKQDYFEEVDAQLR